jgi:hypothetical protein
MNNRGRQDIVRGGLVVYWALAKAGLRLSFLKTRSL